MAKRKSRRRSVVKRAKTLWGYHGKVWQGSGAKPRQTGRWRSRVPIYMYPKKTRKAERLACAIRGAYAP